MWDQDHSRMQPQGSNYAITRPRGGNRNSNVNSITTMARLAASAAILLLAACTGGGSVGIGSGQAAEPGTDFPIAYVKRTIPTVQDDLRQQRNTLPNADLYFRDRASPSAIEVNITERITGADDLFRYDIKDVDASPDGRKIVFAMRGPLAANQNEEGQPNWQIWEYDITANDLRRVITSDITATEGQDIGPQYLPDGRILFTSTRQRQSKAILLDESKPGFAASVNGQFNGESAFLLHVMDPDGSTSSIRQITYNQAHDLWPSVMADGRVLFTRWDGATGRGMHLYTANPDGTNLQLLYGSRSHQRIEPPDVNGVSATSTVQFVRPREMRDGRILTIVRPFTNSDFGGDLVMIDARNYVENTQSLPAGLTGPAQTRVTPNEISTIAGPSAGGRFQSAFPLWDGSDRILVSWSQCRLLDTVTPANIVPCTSSRLADPNVQTAPPLYSAFIFNPADNTFKPLFVPVEGVMITDLVAAQPRVPPAYRPDHVLNAPDFDSSLVSQSVGVLEIRSVYDFDGAIANASAPDIATVADPRARTAAQRPARFLRLEKAVSIGDDDLGFPDIEFTDAIGSGVGFMREILGYAPIEPDGSVSVRVPANVAFVISILDANGHRLFQPHRNWLQIRPGEIRRCNGCHVTSTTEAHGRDGTYAPVPWAGAPFPATLAATAASATAGDTMAQARAKTSCVSGSTCSQVPSVNMVYDDVWTDPSPTGANRPADVSTSYTYGTAGGFNTPPPVRNSCMAAWSATCRIIINYTQHIQPLWDLPRGTAGVNTCTNCHAPPPNALGADMPPGGQLELTSTLDPDVANGIYMKGYTDLTRNDIRQIVVGGALVDEQVPGPIDPDTGLPTLVTVTVPRSLVPSNAAGSSFFNKFRIAPGAGETDHRLLLSDSELRLISEWVDIGAQYFNNPIGLPDAFLDD
jgi:hypothetical protein